VKIAYIDASAGASGDMLLGALVDAGLSLETLREQLAGLAVDGYTLSARSVTPHGIGATKVDVELADGTPPHRHLRHIIDILDRSALEPVLKDRAGAIFGRLAEAEAKVHRTTVERIHFHEVGAVDAIVDIVGTVIGLHALGIERLHCSPLPVSHGWVVCQHGTLPVPPPAVVELLSGVPTRPLDLEGETLTPTGAAILTTLVDDWTMPPMVIDATGYGAGTKDFGIPNVLRLMLGHTAPQPAAVVVLEANLDDMNPEWYDRAVGKLFEAGALDVTLQPLQMKKGRPGVLLRVLCDPGARQRLAEVMMRETTTLGVRWFEGQRECLDREWLEVDTAFGRVRVKLGRRGDSILNIAPEYESCRAVADAADAPLPLVEAAAREAARRRVAGQDSND